jgi:lipopolysaccharide transport system ATP-binding protein
VSEVVIRVDNLGKRYQLGERQEYKMLRDTITAAFSSPARRLRSAHRSKGVRAADSDVPDYIWALKDVSFQVKRGEVVGIIGANGSGKSTLLKILARIVTPTEGQSVVYGRFGALLEVGTGFHPELTGRENIYFNGVVLGLTKSEIAQKFDDIVEFAGVETFLDTPVKHYSSGMSVRLAFAVASQLEADVLIVDEVLSVGDADFQKKSSDKIHSATQNGRTVLFVSHNLRTLRRLCTRGILLQDGRLLMDGPIETVLYQYDPAWNLDIDSEGDGSGDMQKN